MSYTRIFECKSEDDTKNLAVRFADIAKKGDVFALYGTLGVGKSFFSRHFIQHLTDVLDDWTRSQIKKQIDNKGAFINKTKTKALFSA